MTLPDYLRAAAAQRFELGAADCVTLVADWIVARRGVDPMAYCRGYRGNREADALLAGWGGLPRVIGRALRREGLRLTTEPRPGDVGVVALGTLATGAIRTPRGWALRMDDGIASLPPDRVRLLPAAWEV